MRPAPAMVDGMMPALEAPGLMIPGQFGPMMRVVPDCRAYVQNSAESLTATPSVMTTASGILASTASITADLVNLAGTKMTVTSAPVASLASATDPKTGSETPASKSVSYTHLTLPTNREV